MTKRNVFTTRIIATIVTLAMAFTLLAVPASAASVTEEQASNAKAIITVKSQTLNGTQVKGITTKAYLAKMTKMLSGDNVDATTLETAINESWTQTVQYGCEKGTYEIYNGSLPQDAAIGYVRVSDGKTIWISNADIDEMISNKVSDFSGATYNWDKGTMTIDGQEYGIQTGSSDGGALLLVGGVLVAAGAATAVYFYTHPDVWQKAVDAVQTAWNNVTAPVQNAWNSLAEKIPTKESVAAENEAAVNEAGEPAEQAEQTQAAA
jgi:hypothetical protein